MKDKIFTTDHGNIHYRISHQGPENGCELVFLPGLTADLRLFEKQLDCFSGKYPVFVWDAPGHRASRPFEMSFSLEDKARWLNEILETEGFDHPVIIGQSMGGYVGQAYARLFPDKLKGFISIDSAPLERAYYKSWELWVLKRMEPVYRHYPWKLLLKHGSEGAAVSKYGRSLMRSMMMEYDSDKRGYAELAGHGFRIVAEAIEADHSYEISCPALLICGEKDKAGYCVRYNKAWHKMSGIPISWIKGAGHNANTDEPEEVNRLITEFLMQPELSTGRLPVQAENKPEQKRSRKMKLFLTSSPIGIYRSEEPLDYKGFNPANEMVEELHKCWTDDARCILISAFPYAHELNDRMRSDYEGIIRDTGLSLSCLDICDTRNGKEKADALHSYDFVILGGGHVPTENAFFQDIGLADSFRGYQGIVMGISAGTMNCARLVYAQPELPGEASDPAYKRFIPGLGLTGYNLLPHYNAVKDDYLDEMRLMEDIICGDSYGHTFYAITDGSYLFQTEDHAEIRGEAYMIRDGEIRQVCTDGNICPLPI